MAKVSFNLIPACSAKPLPCLPPLLSLLQTSQRQIVYDGILLNSTFPSRFQVSIGRICVFSLKLGRGQKRLILKTRLLRIMMRTSLCVYCSMTFLGPISKIPLTFYGTKTQRESKKPHARRDSKKREQHKICHDVWIEQKIIVSNQRQGSSIQT